MGLLMCADIASLCEASPTLPTLVRALASVATHMGLQVSQLRKGEVASSEVTDLELLAR